jgi:NAD(P)H-hydrate epimerase
MSDQRISAKDLAALMKKTGDAHHAAYAASDGVDPEWAIWYSAHLQTLLGDGLGRPITRSEIVYLLCMGQEQQAANGSDEPWPMYYAKVMLKETAS